MGLFIFVVLVLAAILVSPWFLLGCVFQILYTTWVTRK